MTLPILYSFRRCPYAIRARLAIVYSQLNVEIREVILKDKPAELIAISPKSTVPVLLFDTGIVLEESLDIMYWALSNNDPNKIHLPQYKNYREIDLIQENDDVFKENLDKYKYADRHPEFSQKVYRKQGEVFLLKLEKLLIQHHYLTGNKLSIIDYAIFPFIRQFAHVNKNWFDQSEYKHLKNWLDTLLNSDLFLICMKKYPQWKYADEITKFPG